MRLRDSLRKIANWRIHPDTLSYTIIFQCARFAWRIKLLRPNTRIEVVAGAQGDLILTPLAGSSSVRRQMQGKLRLTLRPGQPLAILVRDDGLRAQSFFNKKVANADTVGKAILLAQCAPLRPQSDVEEFLNWLENLPPEQPIDKHIWPIDRILRQFGRLSQQALALEILTQRNAIEEVIGKPLANAVNTSEEVATYRPPVVFHEEHLARARIAMARIS